MMRLTHFWLFALLLTSSALASSALARAGEPLIDGTVDPGEWDDAESVQLAYETAPGINTTARQMTEARYKVAGGSLFVLFVAREDAPQAMRARRRERDSIFDEDSVGIVIAPAGIRGSEAYSFYVSAGGTQFDSRWNESNSSEDNRWDARWASAVSISNNGYTVEIRVPLSVLSLPSGKEQSWGVNFVRILPRDYRYELASFPRDRNRACYVCQLRPINLMIDQEIDWQAFEVRADLVYQNHTHHRPHEASASNGRYNAGVDVIWRPLYNASAALTLNPDFSQVESDVLRPITNAADAFFYDERRPFFIEAGQSFAQILPLFYSRNIVDPDAAINLRYRGEHSGVALLYAEDSVTQLIRPGIEGSNLVEYRQRDGRSLPGRALALRVQQAVATSTIGATVTARQGDAYSNSVVAVDARVPLDQSITLNTAVAISDTADPEIGGGTGLAAYAQIRRDTLDWHSSLTYDHYSDHFRADMGSMFRVGVHRLQGGLRRTFRFGETGTISDASVQLDSSQRDEIGAGLVDRRTQLSFSMAGTGQTRGTLWLIDSETRFRQRYWPRDGWEFALDTAPSGTWRGFLGLLRIDDVDRLGVRPAELKQSRWSLSWSPSDIFRWQYQGTFRRLEVFEENLFDEQIHDLRGYYFFRNDLYLRGILRSWSLDRNVQNHAGFALAERERSRDWQVLFAWRPAIGTSIYAGLGEGRDVDNIMAPSPVRHRTWFIKTSVSFDRDGVFF